MNVFAILPYFWLVALLAAIIATIVASLMGRPKRVKKSGAVEEASGVTEEPVLDFGDEVASMDK